jgi:hypothetical protein
LAVTVLATGFAMMVRLPLPFDGFAAVTAAVIAGGLTVALQRRDGRIEVLSGNDRCEMDEGDVFVMKTPGGGGYGSPSR